VIQGHLRRFPLFDAFTDEEVRRLEVVMVAERVRSGTMLTREGDPADGPDAAIFLVLAGEVVVWQKASGRGARRGLGSGSLIGVVAVAIDAPRAATAHAGPGCMVARLTRGALAQVRLADPVLFAKLQVALGAQMARDLRALSKRLAASPE
jgi:CRP-like cAMP-binding protein